MLFSIYSQTENVQDPRVSLVNLWGQVITLRGQILVRRTGDAILRVLCCLFCVCAFVRCALCVCLLVSNVWVLACVLACHADPSLPTHPHLSPCVRSKRPPCVCTGTTPASVTGTHKDVLNVHTVVFNVPHHTARTHRDHNDIHNTTRQQHTTSHGDRDRERQRERREREEREKRERRERRDKREREGEREKKETERREKTGERGEDPRFFRCLGRLLDVQLCRGSVFVIKGVEVGRGKSCCCGC